MSKPKLFQQGTTTLAPSFQRDTALQWQRVDGILYTNVRWIVRHHSPDGFEIGYMGSGPADLALNIMAELFPVLVVSEDVQLKTKCWDGHVSATAWELHQAFKQKFLASANRDKGQIEWSTIAEWLDSIRTVERGAISEHGQGAK